jgi:hypothetical protein
MAGGPLAANSTYKLGADRLKEGQLDVVLPVGRPGSTSPEDIVTHGPWRPFRTSARDGERPPKTSPFRCFQRCQRHRGRKVGAGVIMNTGGEGKCPGPGVLNLQVGGEPQGSGLGAPILRRLYVGYFLARWVARCAADLSATMPCMRYLGAADLQPCFNQ